MRITSLAFIGLSVIGCATSTDDDLVDDGADGKADSGRTVVPVTIGDCSGEAKDGYQLANGRLSGNRLLVDVQYGGGCAEHTFKVCWDGIFLESFPVQTGLTLHHDGNGDLCEALPVTPLSIDLTTLGSAYKSMYQTTTGEALISLDDVRVNYKIKPLTSTQLRNAFTIAAQGASYMSESDSEPTWLSATHTGSITESMIRSKFGAKLELESDSAMEITRGDAVKKTLTGWAEYAANDEDYIRDSAQGFGRIKALLEGNLTDLTFARIGPSDGEGGLAVDAGAYNLVVLGKTADGRVVGFFVISVET
ncbi:MAG TPA: hypothetical protein VIV11_35600 [Kofleriaceae bacterium]